MCRLFKLDYEKFGVFNVSFSKVIEEKALGGLLDPLPPPSLVKKGIITLLSSVNCTVLLSVVTHALRSLITHRDDYDLKK